MNIFINEYFLFVICEVDGNLLLGREPNDCGLAQKRTVHLDLQSESSAFLIGLAQSQYVQVDTLFSYSYLFSYYFTFAP